MVVFQHHHSSYVVSSLAIGISCFGFIRIFSITRFAFDSYAFLIDAPDSADGGTNDL